MKTEKTFKSILRARIVIALLIILQLALMIFFINGNIASRITGTSLKIISIAVSLYVISKRTKGAFKLTWVFTILIFPVFGGLLYLYFNFQTTYKKSAKITESAEKSTIPYLKLPGTAYERAEKEIPHLMPQVNYLSNCAGYPIYDGTETSYYSPGEEMLKALLPELKKAEKYIFLEFFIIEEGKMWNSIYEILKEKAKAGVRIRIIYDDMGCFLTLPKSFRKELEKNGIEVAVFNPFRPFLSTVQNNRDHRKIISIDGKVAFTGGINLADEYINEKEKHGHWKDSAVKLTGNAAWGMTLIFLQMWKINKKNFSENFKDYYPSEDETEKVISDGFSQPYADNPLDSENVCEHVYLQIINNAKKYVYINTPYLIIDDSMISALTLAAKSGTDIRIVTPSIWDKWLVHMATRSYYKDLISAGIKIYEYNKGFIHSKTFVADDEVATVGTANLDFRSLYLHFECGVKMYRTKAVYELRDDFLDNLKNCTEITEKTCRAGFFMKLLRIVLRLFAPLM